MGARRIFGPPEGLNLRRVLAAASVAALALVVIAGAQPAPDAHAATTCTRHVKRIVRHVKRHGKPKKIVRLRPDWKCTEVAEPGPATTPAPTAPAPAPAPQPTPEAEPNALGVAAEELGEGHYRFTPSHPTVRAGALTVQLDNRGQDPHDMDMQKVGPQGEPEGEIVEIPPTPRESPSDPKTVEVETGTYRMWCTFSNHAEMGMETTVEVK